MNLIMHRAMRFSPLNRILRPISYIPSSEQKDTIIQKMPVSWRPYAELVRLDKQIGSALLFIPCTWSILMASHKIADVAILPETVKMLSLFGIGSVLMRGAGCIVNDILDVEFDKKVQRTKSRPLASGAISKRNALLFLTANLSASFLILLQLNFNSILLGASSLALVGTYPLAKRITWYPQLMLGFLLINIIVNLSGLTFNWGALLGSSAMLNHVDWPVALPMYLGGNSDLINGAVNKLGVAWTLVYDTIYANQDKLDDKKIGVKSTALQFGSSSIQKRILHSLNFTSSALFAVAGFQNELSLIYFTSVIGGMFHLANIIRKVDLDNPKQCGDAFRNSWKSGGVLSIALVLELLNKCLHKA